MEVRCVASISLRAWLSGDEWVACQTLLNVDGDQATLPEDLAVLSDVSRLAESMDIS